MIEYRPPYRSLTERVVNMILQFYKYRECPRNLPNYIQIFKDDYSTERRLRKLYDFD